MRFEVLLLFIIIISQFSCKSIDKETLGVVINTNMKALFGPNYEKTITYKFSYEGNIYLDSTSNIDDLPYIEVGDTILIRLQINKNSEVIRSKVLAKKNLSTRNSLPSIKLKSGQAITDTLPRFNQKISDSLIVIGEGTKVLKKYSDEDVYLYDLLMNKPLINDYRNNLIDFFVKNSTLLAKKFSGSEELYFSFIVTKTGSVKDLNILSLNNSEEAIFELNKLFDRMPKWEPGYKDGEPVNTILFLTLHYID